jgi:PAS domain S-box-containing protein
VVKWIPQVLVWGGWGLTALSLLFFSLAYTGRGDLLTHRTVLLLLVPVVCSVWLFATNPAHGIFGSMKHIHWKPAGLWLFSYDFSTAYFIYAAYPHTAAVYGVYRLVRSAIHSASLYGKQSVAVAVGAMAPITLGTLFLLRIRGPLPWYVDPTPFGFAIFGLCLGYAIFEYGLLELVPIARRAAWDELTDAVITLDGQNRVLDVNMVARDLFDLPEEYAGTPAVELFETIPSAVLERGEKFSDIDTKVTLPIDGEQRHFSLSVSPIDGDPNGQAGRVIVLRDITSLKRRQEELELLKQVQSRVLRHNIRNEMTTIRGNAELLAQQNDHEKPLLDVVEASEDLLSISRKARLVEEVVDSDARTVACDLRELVEESAQRVRDRYPHTEITVAGPDSCPVEAAPRLEIAIENILENAAEHNDAAEPHVTVEVESGDTPVVTVADNGPGIPEAEIAVLHDERETALEHGSGIGLWLVKWIVDRSEAQLYFETIEEGTRVTLHFGSKAEPPDQPDGDTTTRPVATGEAT